MHAPGRGHLATSPLRCCCSEGSPGSRSDCSACDKKATEQQQPREAPAGAPPAGGPTACAQSPTAGTGGPPADTGTGTREFPPAAAAARVGHQGLGAGPAELAAGHASATGDSGTGGERTDDAGAGGMREGGAGTETGGVGTAGASTGGAGTGAGGAGTGTGGARPKRARGDSGGTAGIMDLPDDILGPLLRSLCVSRHNDDDADDAARTDGGCIDAGLLRLHSRVCRKWSRVLGGAVTRVALSLPDRRAAAGGEAGGAADADVDAILRELRAYPNATHVRIPAACPVGTGAGGGAGAPAGGALSQDSWNRLLAGITASFPSLVSFDLSATLFLDKPGGCYNASSSTAAVADAWGDGGGRAGGRGSDSDADSRGNDGSGAGREGGSADGGRSGAKAGGGAGGGSNKRSRVGAQEEPLLELPAGMQLAAPLSLPLGPLPRGRTGPEPAPLPPALREFLLQRTTLQTLRLSMGTHPQPHPAASGAGGSGIGGRRATAARAALEELEFGRLAGLRALTLDYSALRHARGARAPAPISASLAALPGLTALSLHVWSARQVPPWLWSLPSFTSLSLSDTSFPLSCLPLAPPPPPPLPALPTPSPPLPLPLPFSQTAQALALAPSPPVPLPTPPGHADAVAAAVTTAVPVAAAAAAPYAAGAGAADAASAPASSTPAGEGAPPALSLRHLAPPPPARAGALLAIRELSIACCDASRVCWPCIQPRPQEPSLAPKAALLAAAREGSFEADVLAALPCLTSLSLCCYRVHAGGGGGGSGGGGPGAGGSQGNGGGPGAAAAGMSQAVFNPRLTRLELRTNVMPRLVAPMPRLEELTLVVSGQRLFQRDLFSFTPRLRSLHLTLAHAFTWPTLDALTALTSLRVGPAAAAHSTAHAGAAGGPAPGGRGGGNVGRTHAVRYDVSSLYSLRILQLDSCRLLASMTGLLTGLASGARVVLTCQCRPGGGGSGCCSNGGSGRAAAVRYGSYAQYAAAGPQACQHLPPADARRLFHDTREREARACRRSSARGREEKIARRPC